MDKLLKDKRLATIDDLFDGKKLKIGVEYVASTGFKAESQTTRSQIKPSIAWTKNNNEWVSYTTSGESKIEYENYKGVLRSYIKLKYIWI